MQCSLIISKEFRFIGKTVWSLKNKTEKTDKIVECRDWIDHSAINNTA